MFFEAKAEEKLKKELKSFKERFDVSLLGFLNGKRPSFLFDSLKYYITIGGKRIRPFIFYKLLKEKLDISDDKFFEDIELLKIAYAIEIYHNALLILDDLQDKDIKRRGKPSLWKIIGKEQSINVAFFLINYVSFIIDSLNFDDELKKRLSKVFIEVTDKTVKGQTIDIFMINHGKKLLLDLLEAKDIEEFKNKLKKVERFYLKNIILKTAYYLTLPYLLAEKILESNGIKLNNKKDFLLVGILFQIMNDFEDLKERSSDLKNGIITLPYLLLIKKELNKEDLKKAKDIINMFLNRNQSLNSKVLDEGINRIFYKNSMKILNKLKLRESKEIAILINKKIKKI